MFESIPCSTEFDLKDGASLTITVLFSLCKLLPNRLQPAVRHGLQVRRQDSLHFIIDLSNFCPWHTIAHATQPFLVVEQSEIDFVREGQTVSLQLEELPAQNLTGKILRIAELSADTVPPQLAARQTLPFNGESTRQRLAGTHYQVLAELQSGPPTPFGAAGYAKVQVQPQSLAARPYHWLHRTFRW